MDDKDSFLVREQQLGMVVKQAAVLVKTIRSLAPVFDAPYSGDQAAYVVVLLSVSTLLLLSGHAH